jgi:putative spermidine/putrescine transport system ATP-binding protein
MSATVMARGMPPKLRSLRVRELTKWFADTAAVRRFDLEVSGGEFISLLGPSGCGKTTTLNCVAGLLDPDEGSIEIDGTDITRHPPERRGFGMVFQNYALFPHLTIARNVGFGLEVRGVPRVEVDLRVARALELVQLAGVAKRYPAQLSGGQQQRVALARAVVCEPPLILMDEPLSNLDAKLRLEMRLEIRRLHQSLGLTTLYVTHDQEEALSLADRVVLMRDGVIEQSGTPEDLYAQPKSLYVANFLGYRNLVPVQVGEIRGDTVSVSANGSRFTGTRRGALTAGGTAVATIRPRDVEVTAAGAPSTIAASVELAEFVGDGFELSADAGAGQRFIARTPDRWSAGDRVGLRLPPERLLVFPSEAP